VEEPVLLLAWPPLLLVVLPLPLLLVPPPHLALKQYDIKQLFNLNI
jgi:hypothetical protein